MLLGKKRRRQILGVAVSLTLFAGLWSSGPAAHAAGPPVLGKAWASGVLASSGKLSAEVDPNGISTSYHFNYITKAAYEANIAATKDPFTGAGKAPAGSDPNLGSLSATTVNQQLSGLAPDTAYRYRVVAKNSAATTTGPAFDFTTLPLPGTASLPDGRGWEMVSPVDKNGGQIAAPGELAGGGVLQAAADGQSVTYGSAASFGAGAEGAPPASQYLSTRAANGWSTANLTVSLFSGSYGTEPEGVPYQLFSGDLARGLLLNGRHCRGEGTGCPVANPALPGTDAPAGYQDYYLRQSGSFQVLLGSADLANSDLEPAEFELTFTGASPDLTHSVVSSCAALTPDASEVPLGPGCDSAKANLYLWSSATGLTLINPVPGAALGAQSGAISSDGSRIYWSNLNDSNLYLREGTETKQVDAVAGGGGSFETASSDGAVAFFTVGEHLWRYQASTATATDLTPGGGVVGVLGASADGSYLYFQDTAALKLWHSGTTTVASGATAADAGNYPPTTGTARVSPDGTHLAFLSTSSLTGYDNTDLKTGEPDAQIYLYSAAAAQLTCLSCNPTNARPIGPSTIPGSVSNGQGPEATNSYKPRLLTSDGRRLFFDSLDALAASDTNADSDVYQWETQGTGSCQRPGGCLALISSGRSEEGASLVDASVSGADVFFLTDGSLVNSDPGSVDLYDARIGGGFPDPLVPIPCTGDSCQSLPSEPADPGLSTLASGPGNPGVRYQHHKRRHKKHPHPKKHGHKAKKGSGR